MSVNIDSRASVSPKAQLGSNVVVGPFTIIEDDVVIGDGAWIGPHVVVSSGTKLGRECKVYQGAAVGGPPQDLKYKGEATWLEVGDGTIIREYATLNRGTVESGKTIVGMNCLLMAYSHVAHDCRVGNHVILANCATLGGHVEIGDWAIIGGLTAIHQFEKIGDHTLVGGGLRVTKDVPPYIVAGGEPLIFEGLNIIGLKRRNFSPKVLELLDKTYRILYRSNLNVSQAVERIKQEVELVPEVENVLGFIARSRRGIIPGRQRR